MKLTASLLGGGLAAAETPVPAEKPVRMVGKLASIVYPGATFSTLSGESYRCVAAAHSDVGSRFRLQKQDGSVIAASGAEVQALIPLTAGLHRLANVLKYVLAFNADFDAYVKEAIRAAGHPVDQKVNWSRWLDRVYSAVSPRDPELKDEAIHHVIIKNLFERNTLSTFNPKRLPGDIREMPEEVQITKFLEMLFRNRISEAKMFVNKMHNMYQTDSISQEDEEGSEYNLLDTLDLGQENKDVQQLEEEDDLSGFRTKFFAWLDETQRKQTSQNTKIAFNLVLDSEKGKAANFVEEWVEKTGLTASSLKVALSKLGKFLEQFVSEHEDELDNYIIVKMVKQLKSRRNVESKVEREEAKVPAKARRSSLNLAAAVKTAEKCDACKGKPVQPTTEKTVWCDDPSCVNYKKQASAKTADRNESLMLNGHEYRVTTWEERDRLNISLKDDCCDKELLDLWDDDARAAIEDGFIDPRHLVQSALDYARDMGLLGKDDPNEQGEEITSALNNESTNNATEETMKPTASKTGKTATKPEAALRARIAARRQTREAALRAAKYAKLRQLASQEPHEVMAAFNELASDMHSVGNSVTRMAKRLGLQLPPKEASLKDRVAARKVFASGLKRIAEEQPEVIDGALEELYEALDAVVDKVENFADHAGIELELGAGLDEEGPVDEPPVEEAPVEEAPVEEEGDEFEEEETPAE